MYAIDKKERKREKKKTKNFCRSRQCGEERLSSIAQCRRRWAAYSSSYSGKQKDAGRFLFHSRLVLMSCQQEARGKQKQSENGTWKCFCKWYRNKEENRTRVWVLADNHAKCERGSENRDMKKCEPLRKGLRAKTTKGMRISTAINTSHRLQSAALSRQMLARWLKLHVD